MRLERSPNVRALAWALGIMALLGGMATTRHHLQMMDGHLGGDYATWQHAMAQELPHWIFWALAIPIVYLFVDRVARRRWGKAQAVAAHVAFAGLLFALTTAFRALWFHKSFGDAFFLWASASLFTYAAILGGVLAYYYSRAYVERELELAGAKLSALRGQLRPHFMFNALNSVAMLVRGGRGPEAVEMIARVSDLLRDSLDNDARGEVALAEEVALARRYLAVEEVRFADRLDVRVELSEQAKAAHVPRLILQPIVENAVRHGIGKKAAAGRLEISGRTTDGELIVVVRDDGPGPATGALGNGGVGLKNTRERLQTAYGPAARLTLEHGAEGGAVATITIPRPRR
jgi:anti-sigma regulatory factor (Ser/Thr protein kinase)